MIHSPFSASRISHLAIAGVCLVSMTTGSWGKAADLSVDDLLIVMRANDAILSSTILEGELARRRIPRSIVPKRQGFKIIIDDDVKRPIPKMDNLLLLALRYGSKSDIAIEEVPEEHRPLVKLIRSESIKLRAFDLPPDPLAPQLPSHYRYKFLLAFHGNDVAIRRWGGRRNPGDLMKKLTSIGNTVSALEYSRGEWGISERQSKHPVNFVHEAALRYCFALGVGFGDRVQSASIQSVSKEGYQLSAMISIWPGKTQKAELVVDETGLVRNARIQCVTKIIESSSMGTLLTGKNSRIATSGKVTVTSNTGRIRKDDAIKLTNVSHPLETSDFRDLSDISVPNEPQVDVRRGDETKRTLLENPVADNE